MLFDFPPYELEECSPSRPKIPLPPPAYFSNPYGCTLRIVWTMVCLLDGHVKCCLPWDKINHQCGMSWGDFSFFLGAMPEMENFPDMIAVSVRADWL